MRPGCIEAERKMWWTRNAVVVFPLVPVMPTHLSARSGCPWNAAAMSAIAARAFGTTVTGMGELAGCFSATAAAAPFCAACAMKSVPSLFAPCIAKKREPGPARRES
jgi:tetrahydromethanopterin S-methyltransferase subunit C